MQTINIIAHTEDTSQIEAIKAVLKALKIKFEISTEKPYPTGFISEMQSSLNQVNEIQQGKLPKQSAKDFLDEL